jgi:hypothetical protein
LLRADQATHIDELIEKLETETSSSEIFAALFALELNNKVRQMPGENSVKRVASSIGANIGEECSKTASEILVDSFRFAAGTAGVNSNTTLLLDNDLGLLIQVIINAFHKRPLTPRGCFHRSGKDWERSVES